MVEQQEGPLSKKEFQETINPTADDLDKWEARDIEEIESLPGPSFAELEAIRNETPEETKCAAKHMLDEAMEEIAPLGNLRHRTRHQSPN